MYTFLQIQIKSAMHYTFAQIYSVDELTLAAYVITNADLSWQDFTENHMVYDGHRLFLLLFSDYDFVLSEHTSNFWANFSTHIDFIFIRLMVEGLGSGQGPPKRPYDWQVKEPITFRFCVRSCLGAWKCPHSHCLSCKYDGLFFHEGVCSIASLFPGGMLKNAPHVSHRNSVEFNQSDDDFETPEVFLILCAICIRYSLNSLWV